MYWYSLGLSPVLCAFHKKTLTYTGFSDSTLTVFFDYIATLHLVRKLNIIVSISTQIYLLSLYLSDSDSVKFFKFIFVLNFELRRNSAVLAIHYL